MVKVQTNGNGKIYVSPTGGVLLGNDAGGSSVIVDSAISSTSENPVQNKVIYAALNDKQDTSNLVTSISSSSTDTQYPSAKCVYDAIENNIISGQLPPQSGNNGKFLTTNGTTASWGDTVDYTNITNCIIEIPQNMVITKNSSSDTRHINKGFVIYIPNGKNEDGSLIFETQVIDRDVPIFNIADSLIVIGVFLLLITAKGGREDDHRYK